MKIPRLIHQIWVGGSMPEQYRTYTQTWARLHPDWEMMLWTDESMPELQLQGLYDRAEHWSVPGMEGQFRADIARYELLQRYGGLYVDADFEALKCVEPLVSTVDCAAVWEVEGRWIANGFMAATPWHPFIGRLIADLPASIAAYVRQRPARSTGTQYLTRTHCRYPDQLHVLPRRYFYPYLYSDIGKPRSRPPWPEECYAVHHWNNRRRQLGLAPT